MHSSLCAATVLLALQLAPVSAPELAAQGSSSESGNPACTLLTLAEIRSPGGRNYSDASPASQLGEGLGGDRPASGAVASASRR